MCRLLGWASRAPRTLADLLGEEGLASFTSLSRIHGDGWGAAWRTADGLDLRKSPDAAGYSSEYAAWVHTRASDLGMLHLRWATLGLPVAPENTHPFLDGDVAFAHNGSVRPPSSLDELLSERMRAAVTGDTDSERYFRAVLSRVEEGSGIAEALARTADTIAGTRWFSSLNCLLLTPDTLYAMSRFDPDHDEEEDYFHLRYRVADDAVVVSSTGWGRDWRQLANGELLVVSRGSLATSVVALEDVATGS